MKLVLDENGYFTGDYCTVGDITNSVKVENLPDEKDRDKLLSYLLIDGKWVFDEQHYKQIVAEKENKEQKALTQQTIKNLKLELQSTDYQVIKCMEANLTGEELPYDISLLHTKRQAIRDKINELEG